MSGNIKVRKCEELDEFQCCVELQRQIWGEADLEVEPVTAFVVAAQTGGQVLGAFDDGRMIGYTLAVVGLRGGVAYLHSHMTGVLSDYRDRGVGRMLVEWGIDSARAVAAVKNLVKEPVEAPAIIELPAEMERWQQENAPEIRKVQARMREEFMKWFAKGYAAVGLRTGKGNPAYFLAPWSDF